MSINGIVKLIKESRTYIVFLLVQYFTMVTVPASAQFGVSGKHGLSGLQMVFWVNLFAFIGISIVYLLTTHALKPKDSYKVATLGQMKYSDWQKTTGLSLAWPFLFSICYFVTVQYGPPSLAAVGNRLSILIYIPMSFLLGRKNEIEKRDVTIMLITFICVAIVSFSDVIDNKLLSYWVILLAILAGVFSGVKLAFTEHWRKDYNPILLTLIMEIVTVLVMVPVLMFAGQFRFPANPSALLQPIIIGVFANAIGFWMSIEGFQRATLLTNKFHKIFYLIIQGGLLFFGQILVVSLLKAEVVSLVTWISSIILSLSIVWYSVNKAKLNSLPLTTEHKTNKI